MVSTKKEINFIESYSCDLDFSFLKKSHKYLVEGVVKTHFGLEVEKSVVVMSILLKMLFTKQVK